MKLSEYRRESYELFKIASELARQFTLAGIAIIWVFKSDQAGEPLLPPPLLRPLALLIASIICDFLQYFTSSLVWTFYYRFHEARPPALPTADARPPAAWQRWHRPPLAEPPPPAEYDPERKAPGVLTLPAWLFYLLKILLLIAGYGYILAYILPRVNWHGHL